MSRWLPGTDPQMRNKIYFASDFHLGVPDYKKSREREGRIVRWLDEIKTDAAEIFLVGDVFDFWFEYKNAIPKGFVRLQGKIAEITDSGIPVHWFTGNHDMWIFDYIPSELGVKLYRKPISREFHGKKFFIGHGDGLGPGDHGYKLIKSVFANRLTQWLFARLHPNLGIAVAKYWSGRSRAASRTKDEEFLGDKEFLVQYCKEVLKKEHYDYFIFGHRHLPLEIKLSEKSTYVNLGEWVNQSSYAVLDNGNLSLKYYQ